jgi:two-component system LytT family response regulator
MPRALLIEDEAPACEDLRRLLAAHPEVVIVGEAVSVSTARTRLAAADYDLVFLDIQLIGGSGFELVAAVAPPARIIFVTAHDGHALRAFEVNALDYLLKPVRAGRLAEALARVAASPGVVPTGRPAMLRPGDLVHVKTGRAASRFVALADLVTVAAEDNYSMLRLADGSRLLVRETLTAWEARLPATHFMRVHRQVIVNLGRIEGYSHQDNRLTLLRVAGAPAAVLMRREYWPELTRRLAALGRPLV